MALTFGGDRPMTWARDRCRGNVCPMLTRKAGGSVPTATFERPDGWARLLADVAGRSGEAGHLFTVLAAPIGACGTWSRAELDALWAAAHRCDRR